MKLRKARPNEVDLLNKFAYESEGIWGEDEAYMKRFSQDYCVTSEMVRDEYVYILESNHIMIGFFAIIKCDSKHELELFYINKNEVGKGYGEKLWSEMINVCKLNGINNVELVASQDVVNFYKKMGAYEVKKIESTLKSGRIVTVFRYDILLDE